MPVPFDVLPPVRPELMKPLFSMPKPVFASKAKPVFASKAKPVFASKAQPVSTPKPKAPPKPKVVKDGTAAAKRKMEQLSQATTTSTPTSSQGKSKHKLKLTGDVVGFVEKYPNYVEKDLCYRVFFMVFFPMFNVA